MTTARVIHQCIAGQLPSDAQGPAVPGANRHGALIRTQDDPSLNHSRPPNWTTAKRHSGRYLAQATDESALRHNRAECGRSGRFVWARGRG